MRCGLQTGCMLKFRLCVSVQGHTSTDGRESNTKEAEGRRASGCVWLTAVAGGSRVPCVCAVTVEGAPRLRTLATVLTRVGQTPRRKRRSFQS